ncbi:uncharacterized protein N7484_001893 [Penicillium longicatenatum]|uniref:uncharacterized protein n=1 Tax=Penicillium longicatenatum TaxID=1561947 RepID=UPI00254943F9|nr:uncharacterized protein N7484_001893 [Penicillium longicatenatum]KAJ5658244.1 hypothetical protein N7484_001893 [Penicillium longicatenatum]
MPRTTLKRSPELKIVLDNGTTFIPGETIHGHVLQKPPLSTNISVSICFHAKAEVTMNFSSGMTHRKYTSCFYLFGGLGGLPKIQLDPIEVPPNNPECTKWPFSITIPTHPDLSFMKRNNVDERSYLALGDAPSQELPPTFYIRAPSLGRVIEACVDYYLEATLVSNCKNRFPLIGKKDYKEFKATQPLCVQLISSPTPITDFETKHRSEYRERFVSQRLMIGKDSKLSVGQKMEKMLGSSKVPVYSFSLQLDFATVLQIGNPNTIPLRLGVNTILKETSEVLHNKIPDIVLEQFTLTLLSTTHYTSKRLRSTSTSKIPELQDTSSLILAVYPCMHGQQKSGQTIAIPSTEIIVVPRDSTSPPIDLGIALGVKTPMSSRAVEIYPTFTTYNIKHEHFLEWELTLACAGEVVKDRGKQAVTVKAPSDDLRQPQAPITSPLMTET